MFRPLSDMAFKGILRSSSAPRSQITGLQLLQAMRYSIKIGGDSDTHEDFRPNNKLETSGFTVQDVISQDVKENPVMLYMKGLPDAPRCGFSALAVKVLQQYKVPISARNILEHPDLKEGVKAFSNWPTFPQVFIKGEFVGGSDIILDMHQKGELKELLQDLTKDSSNADGSEN